jgi:hypothetical protein
VQTAPVLVDSGRLTGRVLRLRWGIAQFAVAFALIAGLGGSAFLSARDYFDYWARGPGLFYSFDAGLLQVGRFLASRPVGDQLYLSPDYHDHPTVVWAMDGRRFSSFDGRHVSVLPNSALPATCAIITYEDQTFSFRRFFPTAQQLTTLYDPQGRPYAQVFHIPGGTVPKLSPQRKIDARLGDAIRVSGYDMRRVASRLEVKVYWLAEAPMQQDYTVFVHLIGPPNQATGSPIWAQDDTQPGRGSYPTSRWGPGETIIDQYELRMPPNMTRQLYQVEIGMYSLSTGIRLPIWVNGSRTRDDRILLGEVPY